MKINFENLNSRPLAHNPLNHLQSLTDVTGKSKQINKSTLEQPFATAVQVGVPRKPAVED